MIDATDVKIVNHMLEKGSARSVEIAKALGVSGVTVHNRLKKLRRSGALNGTLPSINPKAFGYDIAAMVNVVVAGPEQEAISSKFARHKNVCALYDTSGHYDIIIVGKFRNSDDLNKFVDALRDTPGVKRTNTNMIFKAPRESVLPGALG